MITQLQLGLTLRAVGHSAIPLAAVTVQVPRDLGVVARDDKLVTVRSTTAPGVW